MTRDESLITDYNLGMSCKDLQSKYSLSLTRVYAILRHFHIPRVRARGIPTPKAKVDNAIREYLSGGQTQRVVAKTYGMTELTLRNYLKKYKVNGCIR